MPVNQWSPDSNCSGNNAFSAVLKLLVTFVFSPLSHSSLICINYYLAIDGGGNMYINSFLCSNCSAAECFPEK